MLLAAWRAPVSQSVGVLVPCHSPLEGFRAADGGFTSSRRFSPTRERLVVPCGQCLGCRVSRREQWKVRMVHEASLHEASCFWTLTYDDAKLPPYGSLRMDDVSAFVKRLRRRVEPLRFRFQAMSEYGPRTFRPHYHGMFYGFDFEDRVPQRRTGAGELSYVSELLSETWGLGHAECSDLTLRSCAYVAKHNVDKLSGAFTDDFYRRVDPETGEIIELERESTRMSNRPGIGRGWVDKFEGDCFPKGFVILGGRKVPVPRYYKARLKGRFQLSGSRPDAFVPVDDAAVMARKAKARARTPQVVENSTPERLAVREEILRLKLKRLRRDAI